MRKILVAIFFVMLATVARAEDPGPSEKIPAGGTLRGTFVQDHSFANAAKTLRTEGRFVVSPERGILWIVEKPFPLNIILTQQGLTQALGTIPISQVGPERMPLLGRTVDMIAAAISGNWAALESDFTVTRQFGAKGGWSATITPRMANSNIPFQSLSAAGNDHVNTARALRQDGGFDKFTFANQIIAPAGLTPAEDAVFKIASQGVRKR